MSNVSACYHTTTIIHIHTEYLHLVVGRARSQCQFSTITIRSPPQSLHSEAVGQVSTEGVQFCETGMRIGFVKAADFRVVLA